VDAGTAQIAVYQERLLAPVGAGNGKRWAAIFVFPAP
jgi:hypothetical protein